MSKPVWAFNCPICKSKSRFHPTDDETELLYQCKSIKCGHTWSMDVEDENNSDNSTPLLCHSCHSPLKTKTHKIYNPVHVRKFMRCINPDCLTTQPLLVTFGRTISPSALGTYDPKTRKVELLNAGNSKPSTNKRKNVGRYGFPLAGLTKTP